MKKRLISGFLLIILGILILYFGGFLLYGCLSFFALYACYEIIQVLDKKFKKTLYISMLLFILGIVLWRNRTIGLILFYIVILFSLAILDADISLSDISATFMLTMVIAFGILGALRIFEMNKMIAIYLMLTSFVSDMGAFFIGRSFGKHKLNERVSPNKTIEGAIGGFIFGFISSIIFAYIFDFFGFNPIFIICNSIALPIISELGDLSFSLIKRNYGVKDFSNIIPGHGGLLDRFDSLLLCIIFFNSMVNFL